MPPDLGRPVVQVVQHLAEHGWVSLRSAAVLLGYNELRGIYQRQRGKNAISTIRIGGIERVYRDEVLELLQAEPETSPRKYHTDAVLTMYKNAVRGGEDDA